MIPGSRLLFALCAVLPGLSACGAEQPPNPRIVRSVLEQRHDKVVIQQWDVSCGAAALASLLTYDLANPVSERDVAVGLLHFTTLERVQSQLGFSLLDLKRYAELRGFTADGYGNMTLRDLAETAPAIVPVVLRGFNHFVVFRGIQGDRVLLADPGWGNRTMQVPFFMQVWQSRVAFTVNQDATKPTVHLMAARSSDFMASSDLDEPAESMQAVAALMDQPPDATQMVTNAADGSR